MYVCKNCGETYHGNFGQCAKCGASMADAPLIEENPPQNLPSVETSPRQVSGPYPQPPYPQPPYPQQQQYYYPQQVPYPPYPAYQPPYEDVVRCPRCGSQQIDVNHKGVAWGKAAVGGLLFGAIGLLAGGIGKNKVRLTCLRCGYYWILGHK